MKLGGFIAFVAVLGTPGWAHAVEHEVCLYFDVGDQFWDASPRAADGREFGEEFGRNEGPTSYPAQRWLARVSDNGTGDILFGWEPLDGNGCAKFDTSNLGGEFTLQWMRWAHWEGPNNHIVSYNCEPDMTACLLDPDDVTFKVNDPDRTDLTISYGSAPTEDPDLPRDMVMWGTSFSQERLDALGENPFEGVRLYPTFDQDDALPGDDSSNHYLLGNQPSFSIQVDAYHRKWTIAHEFGHMITLNALTYITEQDINYCFSDSSYPAVTTSPCPNGSHIFEGREWTMAAALEGIATWVALLVWHDFDEQLPDHPVALHPLSRARAAGPKDATVLPIPRSSPLCDDPAYIPTLNCVSGVSNEWDWASVFQTMRWETGISPETIFLLLPALHESGNWVAAAPNSSAFDSLDAIAQQEMSASEYSAWQTITSDWRVTQ